MVQPGIVILFIILGPVMFDIVMIDFPRFSIGFDVASRTADRFSSRLEWRRCPLAGAASRPL
jgi:hypothetical protein